MLEAGAVARGGVREEGAGVVESLTPPPLLLLLPLRFDKRNFEKRGDQTGQDGNLHKSKIIIIKKKRGKNSKIIVYLIK